MPYIGGDKAILVLGTAGTFPPWSERLDLRGTLTAGARVWGFRGLGDSLLSGVFVKRNILESESYMAQNRLESESLIITKIAKE